jgi:hypothetical protein
MFWRNKFKTNNISDIKKAQQQGFVSLHLCFHQSSVLWNIPSDILVLYFWVTKNTEIPEALSLS